MRARSLSRLAVVALVVVAPLLPMVATAQPAGAATLAQADAPPPEWSGQLPDVYQCLDENDFVFFDLSIQTSFQLPPSFCSFPGLVAFSFDLLESWFNDWNQDYCALTTTGIDLWLQSTGISDIPVVGAALGYVVGGINTLACPAIDTITGAIFAIGASASAAGAFISKAIFTPFVYVFAWTADKLFDIALSIGSGLYAIWNRLGSFGSGLFDGFVELFVYQEDINDLATNLFAIGGTSSTIGGQLGDLVQTIQFRDLQPGEACVAVAGADICPVDFATGINANSSPWSYLSVLWVGFWAVFSTVVGIGAFARMTDS